MTTLDLREAPFDDWLRAIFDHPVQQSVDQLWYWAEDLDIVVESNRQMEFMVRMCEAPEILLESFAPGQVVQGLEFIFGPGASDAFMPSTGTYGGFYDLLWDAHVPWELRERFIAAIPNLWPAVFEQLDEHNVSHMLWDSIAYDYDSGIRHRDSDAEDRRVQDAMFAALTRQLESSVPETQTAALHGIGHLRHPHTDAVIKAFLLRTDTESRARDYARAVRENKFL